MKDILTLVSDGGKRTAIVYVNEDNSLYTVNLNEFSGVNQTNSKVFTTEDAAVKFAESFAFGNNNLQLLKEANA